MNAQELYDILLESDSIILTVPNAATIKTIKARLSNVRSRQQNGLGDMADTSKRLEYKHLAPNKVDDNGEAIPEEEQCPRLRISLVDTGSELAINKVEVAGEF